MARELAASSAAKPKSVVAAGGLFVQVLGIDGMATRTDLDGWVNGANLTVTTVRDPDGLYPQSDRGLETRELSFIVDLKTMKIVARFFGSYGGGQASIDALDSAIADIIRRLGS